MSQYAATTTVSVEKSRAEIETILTRYGATQFAYATDTIKGLATIQFCARGRHVRFILNLPLFSDKRFSHTKSRHQRRSTEEQMKAWEQACRQRWRALCLCIKAKLEAVECGITEFESEFLAHILLPSGETVGQLMQPQIENAYLTGEQPPGIRGLLT